MNLFLRFFKQKLLRTSVLFNLVGHNLMDKNTKEKNYLSLTKMFQYPSFFPNCHQFHQHLTITFNFLKYSFFDKIQLQTVIIKKQNYTLVQKAARSYNVDKIDY